MISAKIRHKPFNLAELWGIHSAKIRHKQRNLAELWGKNFAKIKEMYNFVAVLLFN